MQITRVAQICHLGSQAEFVLGPDESESTKPFIGQNIYISLYDVINFGYIERYVPLNGFL